jgi:hypothetical protein
MTRARSTIAAVLALGLMGSPALAAGPQPFHGAWQGGPADCTEPFRFAERTYTPPGASPMRILRVRKDGRSHRITMEQNYTVVVTVKGRSMLWQSEASGDVFELKRCP